MPSSLDLRDISLIVGWERDPFICFIHHQSSSKGMQNVLNHWATLYKLTNTSWITKK